jgi:ribosomal-protein-alanine N-acetyltransferase
MEVMAAPLGEMRPLSVAALDELMPIELAAYEFPWTRGNFVDSLAVGHHMQGLYLPGRGLVAYFVAMQAVDELHLLNLTVANGEQRKGHALRLLNELSGLAQAVGLARFWLEVRESNARARQIYARYGFVPVGTRRAYYPAAGGQREDAIVMNLEFAGGGAVSSHAG